MSDPAVAEQLHIVDIMKTMDNRIDVDEDTIKQFVPDARLKKLTSDFQKRLTIANIRKTTERQSMIDKML